jgi:hypothetical protein
MSAQGAAPAVAPARVVWYRVGYFLGERAAVRFPRLPGRQLWLGRFGGSRCRVGSFDRADCGTAVAKQDL